MRINRSYAMAAAAWLVLVVVGAVLVWAVISRAGQGVVSSPPGSSAGAAAPITAAPRHKHTGKPKSAKPQRHRPSGSASASPGAGSTSPRPSKPRSSSSPSTPKSAPQSPAPPPASGGAPSPGPGPAPGPGPKPAPHHNPSPSSSPSPPPPKPSSSADSGVRRSWQGSAGSVTVECQRQKISLQGAQPNTGWSIDVDDRGPVKVRVDFESNNGERRTRVMAECVGGTPKFDIDNGDD